MYLYKGLFRILLFVASARSASGEYSPAFPPPAWSNGEEVLADTFSRLEDKLAQLVSDKHYDIYSYSIELTSNTRTLWSNHHSARAINQSRPGTKHVDSDSYYRIASITKTFTVLGILYQHKLGKLHLDDPVNKYIDGLSGELPWNDITLRILASQLSGIPSQWAQTDILADRPDPTKIGLPPVSKDGQPQCDVFNNYVPCTKSDLLDWLKNAKPIFAPNQQSTYSNIAFELLGLVLANVTEMSYESYIRKAIFEPLEMTSTTFDKPSDKHAVLPVLESGPNYWDIDEGVHNPTGGIYSTSADMSKFVRYILTHYNAIATGVNWLQPASWGIGMNNFYGMPWEIYRTEKILTESARPVTFVTKAGGLTGYYTIIILLPEYGLGLTVLTAGESDLLKTIMNIVSVDIIRAAEAVIWKDIAATYDGLYTAKNSGLNSSIVLKASATNGLVVETFISNGTAVLGPDGSLIKGTAQLVPTLLFKDEKAQQGQIWRLTERQSEKEQDIFKESAFDQFENTNLDNMKYAGLPVNELVFWQKEAAIELPAWKVTLKKRSSDDEKWTESFRNDL